MSRTAAHRSEEQVLVVRSREDGPRKESPRLRQEHGDNGSHISEEEDCAWETCHGTVILLVHVYPKSGYMIAD